MPPPPKLPAQFQIWVDARKRFGLSHAHVQMARELGLNPAKLGKIANHRQEPWKSPLPVFITDLYHKNFGKDRPEVVRSIEEIVAAKQNRREERRARREQERAAPSTATPELDAADPAEPFF